MSLGSDRSLDEWYRSINRIYLDRNYYRDSFSIFGHLVEVVGGLSLLASEKRKDKVDPDEFIPKALAWWMALCGRVGVVSVEAMVWSKFPAVCPYCQRQPHSDQPCGVVKRSGVPVDWPRLAQIGERNSAQHPKALGEWQRMFYEVYPTSQGEQYSVVFGRLAEELGELAEALRTFVLAPAYFLSEAADVFAWLMHLKNLRDQKFSASPELGDAFANAYPDKCTDCQSATCVCAPVLRETLGRIAQEARSPVASFRPGGNLISIPEAEELFRMGIDGVRVGAETIRVDADSVRALLLVLDGIRTVIDEGQHHSDQTPSVSSPSSSSPPPAAA